MRQERITKRRRPLRRPPAEAPRRSVPAPPDTRAADELLARIDDVLTPAPLSSRSAPLATQDATSG